MVRAGIAVALTLAAAVLPGCLENARNALDVDDTNEIALSGLMAGPALWPDPQNTPHRAYGFATVSHPPSGADLPRWWQPIAARALPEVITGISHLAQAPEPATAGGGGISLFGSLAIVPGFGSAFDTYILDISDPTHPAILSSIDDGGHRGSATIAYPDGRLVAVFSMSSGIDSWDITDPTDPVQLQVLDPGPQRSHKLGVVPGTPIVYNAGSDGGGDEPRAHYAPLATNYTEIYDFSDPDNPYKVKDWQNGYSCHHVYFWNDPSQDKYRAVCAGIEYTQIWDTADPLNPEVIVSVPVHHGVNTPVGPTPSGALPILAFSHYAGLSMDGTILLVGDESGGGGYPPGCVASVDTPAGAVSTPIGALWFYDVSDESNPQVLGWYTPLNDPRENPPRPELGSNATTWLRSCTAHHGRLVPDPQGRDLLAMSFYGEGVVLIDFTGIGTPGGPLPRMVDQFVDDSDTWETWYYQGYLFTGDLARGLDVLTFE